MGLDPNGKYLRQEKTGTIYVWSKALAKRSDMRPFDPVRMKLASDLNSPTKNPQCDDVPIELQGETFLVPLPLKEILVDMLAFIDELKAENQDLKGGKGDSKPKSKPKKGK